MTRSPMKLQVWLDTLLQLYSRSSSSLFVLLGFIVCVGFLYVAFVRWQLQIFIYLAELPRRRKRTSTGGPAWLSGRARDS